MNPLRRIKERRAAREAILTAARACAEAKWEAIRVLEVALKEADLKHPNERISCWACKTAGCCKQLALCTTFEAFILADRLARTDPERLTRITDQGRLQWARWSTHGLADLAGKERTSGWWFDRDELCALYEPGAGCSVYSDRPMTCASYFVITPAAGCEPPSGKRVGAVNNAQQMLEVLLLDHQFAGNTGGTSMPIGAAILCAVEALRRAG